MKKLIAFVLALVCVLGLVGCNAKSNEVVEDFVGIVTNVSESNTSYIVKVIDIGSSHLEFGDIVAVQTVDKIRPEHSVNDYIRVEFNGVVEETSANKSISRVFTIEKTGSIDIEYDEAYAPTEDIVTDIVAPNLNMQTLKDLVKQYGESLTWSHFDSYYSESVTQGLYTRSYPIDTEYSLLIIGDTDKSPTAILLVSVQNPSGIDIRTNSIDDFINEKYTYEELSQMPAKELLDLFIQNGLVINDDLKASFTEEELQKLFKENFHLWHTGVSAHSYTMYIDLAEQTKVIYDKIIGHIDIPNSAHIEASGRYPKNENGESYGPDIYDNTDPTFEPDLILARNKDGLVGYIKKADIQEGASSLEEAINWKPRNYTIPMYLEDGVTIIGEFEIGNECEIETG